MSRAFDDASSQYTSANAVVTAAPLSMSCWFQTDATELATAQRLITICDADAVQTLFGLHIGANAVGLRAQTLLAGSGGTATNSVTINASTWYHGAAVFASSSSRAVYFQGANKGTDSTSSTPTGLSNTYFSARVGASYPSGVDFVSGLMAEAGIWNVALTDAEVAVLAAGYSPLFIRPANLVAYWPLYGNLSPEKDRVGGYDMTLINAPTKAAHPRVIYPAPLWVPTQAAAAGPAAEEYRRRFILAMQG